MPITTLDAKTALVVIDLQKGIVSRQTVHPIAGVVANAAALLDAFRKRGLPVVLVNVAGGAPGRSETPRLPGQFPAEWTEFIAELNAQESDLKITKWTWGAFHDTPLHEQLKARGATQIVLAGVSTSIGVESTARQAFERGYNVSLAIDAMTDTVAECHENSVARIFPRLGETGSTTDILAKLSGMRA